MSGAGRMLLSMGTMWGLSPEVLQPANEKFPELQGVCAQGCARACVHVCVCTHMWVCDLELGGATMPSRGRPPD